MRILERMGVQMAEVCRAKVAPGTEGSPGVAYEYPADIWAVGVLACELLTGASPFEGDTKEETYAKILAGNLRLPSHLSAEARDFIQKVRRALPCIGLCGVLRTCYTCTTHPTFTSQCKSCFKWLYT